MQPTIEETTGAEDASRALRRVRIRRIAIAICAALFLCPLLVIEGRRILPQLWGNLHLINFIVAWIPAVLSILVAFIPDKELEPRFRVIWRFCVIACGVLYSVTLWHQQGLTDDSNSQTQKQLLAEAIRDSNKHADEQFGKVHGEVQGLASGLQNTKDELESKFLQSTQDIDASIGKVGRPDPPHLALLQFSFWPEDRDLPTTSALATENPDGSIQFEFIVINNSDVAAEDAEVWVHLCSECDFVKEPEGFDKPEGISAQSRHRRLGTLNPGVTFQKTTVTLKASQKFTRYGVSFSYSCKNCGATRSTPDYFLTVYSLGRMPRTTVPKTQFK